MSENTEKKYFAQEYLADIVKVLRVPPKKRSSVQMRELDIALLHYQFYQDITRQQEPEFKLKLLDSLHVEVFPRNTVIYSKGDPANRFWFILSGQVCICTEPKGHFKQASGLSNCTLHSDLNSDVTSHSPSPTHDQVVTVVQRYASGQFFGESEILFNTDRVVSAFTDTAETYLWHVSSNLFQKLVAGHFRSKHPYFRPSSFLQLVPLFSRAQLYYHLRPLQYLKGEVIYGLRD